MNSFQNFLPGFVQGCLQLRTLLLAPAALVCYGGLLARLPTKSMEAIGNSTLRFLLVVIVIANVIPIGNAINSMATGITESSGFSMATNMWSDYQQILATKFNVKTSSDNPNPLQFLFSGTDAIGASMLGTIVWVGSLIACSLMFFMGTIQQVLFYLEIALSPLLLSCLVAPALTSIGIRFCTFFVAICIWPLGFRIIDLIVKACLSLALNESNNPGLSVANAMGGNIIWWIVTMVVAFAGYPLSAWFISRSIVTSGSHGLGSYIPALFGMGMMGYGMASRGAATAAGALGSMEGGPPPSSGYMVNYTTRPKDDGGSGGSGGSAGGAAPVPTRPVRPISPASNYATRE